MKLRMKHLNMRFIEMRIVKEDFVENLTILFLVIMDMTKVIYLTVLLRIERFGLTKSKIKIIGTI